MCKLQDELGKEFFETTLESCISEYCLSRKEQALKNPFVIQEILTKAMKENKKSVALENILDYIIALKKTIEI